MKSFSQELLRFIVLYRQGKLSTNLFAVIFITIAIIICYPIFYFGYPLFHYWETIKIQVLIHLGIDLTPIEGDDGLPLIGETIDYKVNSDQFFKQKRKRFGNIFTTRLDLSDHTRGTSFFHLSKKIICLHELPSIYLPKQKMTRIGYYGSQIASFEVLKQYDQLYQALFRGSDYHRKIFRCENKIKQLTQTFLKRLIYESSFTFADKINQLCCEIMSTLFLGMKGLPVTLLHAMNRYLSQSYQQIRYLSDANADKDVIMNHILVAIFEEDRQYYDYNEQGKKSKSFVMDLLDAIDQVFVPVDGNNDNELEKIHVYFVFFVEYCYRQSVDLVRKALSKLLIDSNSKDDHSFYKRFQRLKEQEMIDIYHTMDGEDIARESTSSLPPSATPVKFPVISKFRSFSEDVLYVSPMKTALGSHNSAAETPQSAVRPPIVPLTPIADTIPDSIDDIIEGVIMEVKSEQSKQIHNSYAIYQCKERLMVSYSKEVKSTPAKIKSLSEMKEKEKEKEANPPTQRQHNFTIKPSQLILEIYDANIYHQEDPMSLPLLELSSDTIFDSLLRIFLTELLYDYEWQTGLPAASKTVGLGKHQCDRSESQGFSLIPDDALPVCCFRMKNLR